MADTTGVGTKGWFRADAALPGLTEITTGGWWDTFDAGWVPPASAVSMGVYHILGLYGIVFGQRGPMWRKQ